MSGPRRVVIVGASAAGLRCACRLARLEPATVVTVFEEREVFSLAACGLPYALAGDIDSPDELRRTADGTLRDAAYFSAVKRIDVRAGWRAVSIDPGRRAVRVAKGGEEDEVGWDELVIATGARPRRLVGQPEHPWVHAFHTAADLTNLHRGLATGAISSAVVVGAGLVGCELAEAFRSLWGADVALVEAASAPLPGVLDAELGAIVARTLAAKGVRVLCGCPAERITADEHGVEVVTGGEAVRGDVLVVAVGAEPEVSLASAAGVALGPSGAIAVDDRLATSVPHVWAAGDCVEVRHAVTGQGVHLPLGSLANRQGRTLANLLAGREDRFPPVAGAVAVKVFDCNVAAVGIGRAQAGRCGLAARSVWTAGHDRAHYWPEAKEIFLHLVYEQGTGRVLGVQAVGEGDAVKRIDVATQLVARGATLEQFGHLEHAYAPPYAPAVDPLAVAAWVAANQEDSVGARDPVGDLGGVRVLDVRNPDEQAARPAPGTGVVTMPLDRLRPSDLPGQGPWLVACERGTRSAEAVRRLAAAGVKADYLGGGLHLRAAALGEGV